jgi:hypothetical protein
MKGLGEEAPEGGLAGAARAAEEVGVGEAAGRNGVAKRACDGVLAGDFREGLGAPLAVEDFGHGAII